MTRFSTVEIDSALPYCHHQDHLDEGFMGVMTCF